MTRFEGMNCPHKCNILGDHEPHQVGEYYTQAHGVLQEFCLGRNPQSTVKVISQGSALYPALVSVIPPLAGPGGFTKVEITCMENGHLEVAVTKRFEQEYGGGVETFRQDGGVNWHRALDVAREMVTFSPCQRTT